MKFRIIASLLLVAVLAALAFLVGSGEDTTNVRPAASFNNDEQLLRQLDLSKK